MAKYTFEFKKKVVMAYLNGEGGKEHLAKNTAYQRRVTSKSGQTIIVQREMKDYEDLDKRKIILSNISFIL